MNFKKVRAIFKKEILEVIRDKRTMFTVILFPMILYPIIFIGFSSIMMVQAGKLEKKGANVNVVWDINPENQADLDIILEELKKQEALNISTMSADYEFPDDAKPDATITIRDSLTATNTYVFITDIKYDNTKDSSEMGFGKIGDALKVAEKKITTDRLAKIGIGDEYLNLIITNSKSTASTTRVYGKYAGSFLPYILMMFIVSGGAVVATDLIAGEKERKTLETLLISAAKRNEIVLAKYLTIMAMSALNVVVNLFSLSISMKYLLSNSGLQSGAINMPLINFVYILIALLPLITLFSALLLSISTFARNIKEAKSYESPLMMMAMFAGMVTMFPGIDLNIGIALIPIVNVALLMREILMGDFIISHFLVTVGSILVLDVIAIFITVKLFNSEGILFRTEEETNLKNVKKDKKNFFNPMFGIVYFTIALLAFYYLGSYWQSKDAISGLMRTQIFIILLPPFVITRLLKLDKKEIFRQKMTKPVNFGLVILGALPLAIAASSLASLVNLIYPIPPEYLEKLAGLISMEDTSLLHAIVVIGLLPGVCEELMFRGFITRFFENGKTWIPIIISALLFAIYHLDPFRLLSTFLLGIYMGFLLYKTKSIFIPILAHALNNSIAVLFTRADQIPALQILVGENGEINNYLIPIAFAIVAGVIYLFVKMNPTVNQQEVIE